MRILHAISSVNPAGGGPIEGVKQLSRVAEREGHEIEIASLDSPGADYLTGFPLKLYPLGPSKLGYALSPRFVPWLRKNAARYNVVIVNGIWQYQSFGVWRALRKSSTPYVVFTHGMLDPWFKRTYPLKHLKKWLYWPWGEYRVLRDAAAVLFTCEDERLLARKSFWLYSANEKVVNYGTSGPPPETEMPHSVLIDSFPELGGKRLLLFMGRLHPKKGCDLALAAFAKTLAADPNWHLVMAGPDQTGWKTSLLTLATKLGISDQVTWAGTVTGALKWRLFNSAEALFLPSHQENFGIVVAEALACSLPVLISDKVNIWQEIKHDGAGIVAADSYVGACSLLKCWVDLSEREKLAMRTRARKSFLNRFEIRKASQSLLSVLLELSGPGQVKEPGIDVGNLKANKA